jgi:hypothetical protein
MILFTHPRHVLRCSFVQKNAFLLIRYNIRESFVNFALLKIKPRTSHTGMGSIGRGSSRDGEKTSTIGIQHRRQQGM